MSIDEEEEKEEEQTLDGSKHVRDFNICRQKDIKYCLI